MRVVALALLALILSAAVCLVTLSRYSYATQDRDQISAGSVAEHRAGTDELGRDRLVRTAGAALLGLTGALTAASLASVLAVCIGLAAAFAAPWASKTLMYLCDLSLTLPWIFLLMIVRAALPLTLTPVHSVVLTFLLLAVVSAPIFVRVNYTRALGVRRAGWLVYGRASGLAGFQLTRTHILPHLKPIFLTQMITCVPVCLIAEANLGALGLGISQPLPSWGSMLLELQQSAFLSGSRWLYMPLGVMVLVLFLLEMVMFEVNA